MTKLNPKTVESLMKRCALVGMADAVTVKGLVNNYHFDKAKIQHHSTEIGELLGELPEAFQAKKGGGWSFLNACADKDGELWTGEHRTMEQLFCLGIAAGRAKWLMREMADIMPGGVPYVVVLEPGDEPPPEPIGITI